MYRSENCPDDQRVPTFKCPACGCESFLIVADELVVRNLHCTVYEDGAWDIDNYGDVFDGEIKNTYDVATCEECRKDYNLLEIGKDDAKERA